MSIILQIKFEIKRIEEDILELESRLRLELKKEDFKSKKIFQILYPTLSKTISEATIKRFEVTVESFKKLFEKLLSLKKVPQWKKKQLIQKVSSVCTYIEEGKWIDTIDLRNDTVHEFHRETLETWISKIKENLSLFKDTIKMIVEKE